MSGGGGDANVIKDEFSSFGANCWCDTGGVGVRDELGDDGGHWKGIVEAGFRRVGDCAIFMRTVLDVTVDGGVITIGGGHIQELFPEVDNSV